MNWLYKAFYKDFVMGGLILTFTPKGNPRLVGTDGRVYTGHHDLNGKRIGKKAFLFKWGIV
jgi:hypothetical protein